jgi:hypothetical protein
MRTSRLLGAYWQRERDFEAERFCGRGVHHQLELGCGTDN